MAATKRKWSEPIERAPASKWLPKKGEVREFIFKRAIKSKYGTGYIVQDDAGNDLFLPNHTTLNSRLDNAGLKPGWLLRIKCIRKGSKKQGDYYDYEVRTAKANAPF